MSQKVTVIVQQTKGMLGTRRLENENDHLPIGFAVSATEADGGFPVRRAIIRLTKF